MMMALVLSMLIAVAVTFLASDAKSIFQTNIATKEGDEIEDLVYHLQTMLSEAALCTGQARIVANASGAPHISIGDLAPSSTFKGLRVTSLNLSDQATSGPYSTAILNVVATSSQRPGLQLKRSVPIVYQADASGLFTTCIASSARTNSLVMDQALCTQFGGNWIEENAAESASASPCDLCTGYGGTLVNGKCKLTSAP